MLLSVNAEMRVTPQCCSARSQASGFIPPLAYLCAPFLIWAALGFGLRAATLGLATFGLICYWHTAQGFGPFSIDGIADWKSILHLQAYLATIVVTTLFAAALLNERQDELSFFDERIEKGLVAKLQGIVSSEFVRMEYGEAIGILERANDKFQYPVRWGVDLQSEHERYLTEKHVKKPVIVMNYPKDIKAFYMRANDDGKTVAAMDVLLPRIGEIIGGSQREERHDLLLERIRDMAAHGMKEESYWWYLDLRRFGGVEHAGFGMGFERMMMYLTGMKNIRDVIPFPRTPGNAEF